MREFQRGLGSLIRETRDGDAAVWERRVSAVKRGPEIVDCSMSSRRRISSPRQRAKPRRACGLGTRGSGLVLAVELRRLV